jgi:hypothetical protein
LVVVRINQENERSDADDGSDSDCEIESDNASGSVEEAQADKQGETKPESPPVLTIGSFARYAQYILAREM